MGVKTALSLMDVAPYEVRLPLCQMRPENAADMKEALASYQQGR